MNSAQLRHEILRLFSEEELRELCFDIGLDYETLPGESKAGRVRELLLHYSRRERLPELLAALRERRPSALWPEEAAIALDAADERPAAPTVGGDSIAATIGAGASGVAVGKGISQRVGVGDAAVEERPPERETPERGDGAIRGQVGAGSKNVAIGRGIIQIGQILLPWWTWLLVLLVPLLLLAIAWFALVPDRMDESSLNIAVAPFGELSDGRVRPSERGALFSDQLYDTLARENQSYLDADSTHLGARIWYDGMPSAFLRKRAALPAPTGAPEALPAQVEALAERVNADAVVYGYLASPTQLRVMLYLRPEQSAETNVQLSGLSPLAQGHFAFGDPVRATDPKSGSTRLPDRARTLFLLLLGLRQDRLGDWAGVLRELRADDERLNAQVEQGQGYEFRHFFIAKAALGLGDVERSMAAFEWALATNPDFLAAQIGRGTVHLSLAQCFLSQEEPDFAAAAPEVAIALARYAEATALASNNPNRLAPAITDFARGSALYLDGFVRSGMGLPRAVASLEESAALSDRSAEWLALEGEARLAAQGFTNGGSAHLGLAQLFAAEPERAAAENERAAEAFGACIALSAVDDPSRYDAFLEETLIDGICRPLAEGRAPTVPPLPICEP